MQVAHRHSTDRVSRAATRLLLRAALRRRRPLDPLGYLGVRLSVGHVGAFEQRDAAGEVRELLADAPGVSRRAAVGSFLACAAPGAARSVVAALPVLRGLRAAARRHAAAAAATVAAVTRSARRAGLAARDVELDGVGELRKVRVEDEVDPPARAAVAAPTAVAAWTAAASLPARVAAAAGAAASAGAARPPEPPDHQLP